MIVEFTDSSNIAQVYGYMPVAWSLGGTIGPLIGGSLSRPAEQFPGIFGQNEFLKTYPYFLPCAIAAAYALSAVGGHAHNADIGKKIIE
ncbi:hypothetical protein H0H92_002045 [Tricholoma furcatifolium]|nr:hypothetical protein H0H92_002045 [Tricholoma furcatifolium]